MFLVLVVDDELVNLFLLKHFFQGAFKNISAEPEFEKE